MHTGAHLLVVDRRVASHPAIHQYDTPMSPNQGKTAVCGFHLCRMTSRGRWSLVAINRAPAPQLSVTPCWCRRLVGVISSDLPNFNLARPVHVVANCNELISQHVIYSLYIRYNLSFVQLRKIWVLARQVRSYAWTGRPKTRQGGMGISTRTRNWSFHRSNSRLF